MKLLKTICIFTIALSMVLIPNRYIGVIKEVYGDATVVNGLGNDEGTLVWSDDFDGNSLDTTKWNNEGATGAGGYGNKELQDYEMDYCEVKDGKLIIKPTIKWNRSTNQLARNGYNYECYSTKLWTKNQFNFKNGRIEITAKLPKAKGTWAAGWMLGTGSDGSWPRCGEIDIFETTSESSKTLIPQSIHCQKFNGMPTSSGNKHWDTTVDTATTEYHRYGAIWNDKTITFTVDGIPKGTYDPSMYSLSGDGTDDSTIWPFNESAYLILNCAIGGTLGGSVDPTYWTKIASDGDIDTYQDKMYIDSVKVYKTKKASSEETTTEDSGSDNPDVGGTWDSYFGANDGSFWEGALGSLNNVSNTGFTARMEQVGWGGVWGGQARRAVNIKKGKKYCISFKVRSTNVDKYIYIKIAKQEALAHGFWEKLPKGQTVTVNESFIAKNDADQIIFGIGGDFGDRSGASDLDADERYNIFDQQFGANAHTSLLLNDANGDAAAATNIIVSDYTIRSDFAHNIDDFDYAVSGNQIALEWKDNEYTKELVKAGQTYNVYLDGVLVGSGINKNSYIISNVSNGFHHVGVSATYKGDETEPLTKLVGVNGNNNNTNNNQSNVANNNKTSIKKIKAKKKSLKITWKKVKGVNGYQLQYGRKKSMKGAKTVTIKKATDTSKTIKKLNKKKKYYVRIRTFILNKGKSIYSPWSAVKAKKTK